MTEKHKSERLIVVTSVMIMFCIRKTECTAHIFFDLFLTKGSFIYYVSTCRGGQNMPIYAY